MLSRIYIVLIIVCATCLYAASHHEEETLEELSSRAASRMTAVSRMSGSVVMSRVPTSTGDRPTEDTRVPGIII